MEENQELQTNLKILKLQPGATIKEVKDHYHSLVKILHPDKYQNDPKPQHLAEEELKKINAAYEWIMAHRGLLELLSQNKEKDAEQKRHEQEQARQRQKQKEMEDRKREQEQRERREKRREEQKKYEQEWARWNQKQQQMDDWKREEHARQDQRKSAYDARWKRDEAEREAKRKRTLLAVCRT